MANPPENFFGRPLAKFVTSTILDFGRPLLSSLCVLPFTPNVCSAQMGLRRMRLGQGGSVRIEDNPSTGKPARNQGEEQHGQRPEETFNG